MTTPADGDPAPLFRLFWENSTLDARRAPAFAEQIDEDARRSAFVPQLHFPWTGPPLPRPDDDLHRLEARRASRREFASRPLSQRQLGSLLSGFAAHGGDAGGRRLLPSAGGKYPVEVFALLFSGEGDLDRSIAYYECERHALARLGPCPPFAALAEDLGVRALTGAPPSACIVFTIIPSRSVRKYGERGGRFALMEVGHYAQSLALRLEQEQLAGYELGGLRDEPVRRLLGLEGTEAMVALGYLVGAPAHTDGGA